MVEEKLNKSQVSSVYRADTYVNHDSSVSLQAKCYDLCLYFLDWQRGKIPYFVPPVGCEMPPQIREKEVDEENSEIKKDQNFQEIKVAHEYDPEDLQDMSIGEENHEEQTIKDENNEKQAENDEKTTKKSENVSEKPNDVGKEENLEKETKNDENNEKQAENEVKKRKLEEDDPELPLEKKRKTEPTELVQTSSGVFVVTDSKE